MSLLSTSRSEGEGGARRSAVYLGVSAMRGDIRSRAVEIDRSTMHQYRHFDDDLNGNHMHSSAILSEMDADEPFQVEFQPPSNSSPSKFNRLKVYLVRRTPLERCLMLAVIFLLVTSVVSTFFYHRNKSSEPLCLTSACVEAAYSLSSGMNQSIDPCTDFHEFVCGRWVRTNLIPKGHASWSTTKALAEKNMITLKTILEQDVESAVVAEQEAMKFYRSCSNVTELERLHLQPWETFLQSNLNLSMKQWIDLDRNRTCPALFVRLTEILAMDYGFSYVLPMHIEPDEKNSSWYALHVSPTSVHGSIFRSPFIADPPAAARSRQSRLLHSVSERQSIEREKRPGKIPRGNNEPIVIVLRFAKPIGKWAWRSFNFSASNETIRSIG